MAPTLTVDPPPPQSAPSHDSVRPVLRGWMHAGALLATLVAGPILVAHAHDAGAMAALVVYVLSLVSLFGVSSTFHRFRWSPKVRRGLRRADHTTIFVAIAGSYTAVATLALGGWARVTILLVVWIGAGVGIAVRQVWLDLPKWAIAIPYVVVGWCAIAFVPQLVAGLTGGGFGLLIAGGACYTIGALAYATKWPNPSPRVFGYHEVFHLFTIAGASLHFVAIAAYALPRS